MADIHEVMRSLVGQQVLAVSSDVRSGSLFDIGVWLPRRRRIENPNLTEQQANSEGSHTIFVECLWELYSPVELRDDPTRPFRPGERLSLLDAVVGGVITEVSFVEEQLSLVVGFDTGMTLALEPSKTSPYPEYSISADGDYITVYADGRIEPWSSPVAKPLAELRHRWSARWPSCRPIGDELRLCAAERWVRFHSLPASTRYPDSAADYAELLGRHHLVIDELLDSTSSGELTIITTAWSDSERVTSRLPELDEVLPAEPWMRVLREIDDDGDAHWAHLFVSRTPADDSACVDRLLRLVADGVAADVIITDAELNWLYHPYDGGADVIVGSQSQRDKLRAAHPTWLSAHPLGL